jgi:hypothetical protein
VGEAAVRPSELLFDPLTVVAGFSGVGEGVGVALSPAARLSELLFPDLTVLASGLGVGVGEGSALARPPSVASTRDTKNQI